MDGDQAEESLLSPGHNKQEPAESEQVDEDSDLPSPAPTLYPGVQPSLDTAVETTRVQVQRQLGLCQHFVITLELTRMRQSRIGSQEWFELWHNIYTERVCSRLSRKVTDALPVITRLFFSTVQKLCALIEEIGRRVQAATSVEGIDKLVDEMSERGLRYCEERSERATHILDAMRRDFANVPINITDKIFAELKRDAFGVDENGNYYPYVKPPRRCGNRLNRELDAILLTMEDPELAAHDGFTSEFQSSLEAARLQLANARSLPYQRRGGLSIEIPVLIRALQDSPASSS